MTNHGAVLIDITFQHKVSGLQSTQSLSDKLSVHSSFPTGNERIEYERTDKAPALKAWWRETLEDYQKIAMITKD